MNKILIGIIGSTGRVGREALNILKEKYEIRAGYRNSKPCDDHNKDVAYKHVDIMDAESLYEFCRGCSVILNCAGPSYIITDKAACMACKAGADYIDAYGTYELRNSLRSKGIEDKNLYVLGTGVYPGLSGIFSKYMSRLCSGGIEKYYGFIGSYESIGKTAAMDLLNSSASSFGIANGYYENSTVKIEKYAEEKKLFIPYNINNNVLLNEYLNEEVLDFAKNENVKCAKCYNIVNDKEYTRILAEAYSLFAQKENTEEIDKLTDELVKKASNVKKPWNVLIVETEGCDKTNNEVKKRGVVYNESGYKLSGIILALVTIQIVNYRLENKLIRNGVYWPYEITDSEFIINEINKFDMNIHIQIEAFESSILDGVLEEYGII